MPTLTTLAAAGFLLLGASSLVAATPAPDRVRVRQDGVANFPVAATLAAQMLPDVDPVFKADLEANVVINLDQPLVKSRRGRRDWYGPDNPHGSKREPQEGGGANPEIPPVGEPVGRRAPQSSGAKPDPEEGGGDDPRTHKGRQTSTCTIEGYAIVNQQLTPFQGTVENRAENHGRLIYVVNVTPGCVMGVVPQADCKLWAVTESGGCGTASLTAFN